MKTKKIFSILVVPILFFMSITQTANAQWPGIEVGPNLWVNTASSISNIGRTAKDYVLDGVAWVIAKQIVAKLTAQTVNWINTGFQGNPAFVTDPDKFFLDIGDTVAADFLTKLSKNGRNLCSPFKAQVRLALVKNYLSETDNNNYTCTLGQLERNYGSFVNNFKQGGWNSWLQISQNNQNNPYGSFLEAQNTLHVEAGNEQTKAKADLAQGKGFLSFKSCDRYKENVGNAAEEDTEFGKKGDCIPGTSKVQTPGSVIEAQLNHILPSGADSLKIADSINEIVGSLVTQLVGRVVGGVGKGLRGLTQSGSGQKNTSKSYFDELNTESSSIGSDVARSLETGAASELRASVPARDGQPFIILKGRNPEKMYVGDEYKDAGASAFDSLDGEISGNLTITGTVNVGVDGTNSITFNVSNSKGVAANTVTRQVIVEKEPTTPTCTAGQIGTWPACTSLGGNGNGTGGTTCPAGQTGTPPNCVAGGTPPPPPSNTIPIINAIHGYNGQEVTNIYAGNWMILYGSFATSGNKVVITEGSGSYTKTYTILELDTKNQINIFLDNKKGLLQVQVSNGNLISSPIGINVI